MSMLPSLALFALSASITPGPNNAMIMASGVNHGVRKSLPHFAGINLGFFLMVIGVGFGLGAVFEAIPTLHTVIKVLGILYLLYLAWLIATTPTMAEAQSAAKPLTLAQAALFQWVNPKAWVMISGAIATFTSSSSTSIYLQVLVVATVFITVGTPSCLLWLFGGVGLRRFLNKPQRLKAFNIAMALLLIASLYPVIQELLFL